MNRLFLLIPAVGDVNAGQDIAYLKQLGEIDNEGVLSILRRIVQSMKLVAEEDFELLYDEKYFKGLLRNAKREMPQMENILVFFNDAVSIQQRGIGNTPFTINGMTVSGGLVNAFMESRLSGDSLLNKDALAKPQQPIEVRNIDSEQTSLIPLPCETAEVYLWFVENRTPQRQLDPNYRKHGKREKTGKGGVRISSITYSELQLEDFLKRAVVARKGLRELYFKDNSRDKIIIFWDENLERPSYHAMEIDADDAGEIQKIFRRGGRKLNERIEETSHLI